MPYGPDAWSCLATWPGRTSLKIIPVLYEPAYRPLQGTGGPGRPRHTWLRTVEEDLRQFNLGLASGLRRAQNRTTWRTLTGTATSPTSSDWLTGGNERRTLQLKCRVQTKWNLLQEMIRRKLQLSGIQYIRRVNGSRNINSLVLWTDRTK